MAGILGGVRGMGLMAGLALAAAPVAAADAAAGQKVFETQCAICHAAVAGGRKIGPTLFGIGGRTSGTVPGYAYSKPMKAAALVWTPAGLKSYLAAPRKAVPGTKMTFAGVSDPKKLDDLVAYLGTLK